MKVYRLEFDCTYRAFSTENPKDYVYYEFNGVLIENWTPKEIFPSNHSTEKNKKIGDIIGVDISSIVINDKAFKVLYPIICNEIQILETSSGNEKLYVLNVINVLDCLDKENSELEFFPNSDRLMSIEKYSFLKDNIGHSVIFKIPEESNGFSFATDEFYNLIIKNNIKGFNFKLLWDSETTEQ